MLIKPTIILLSVTFAFGFLYSCSNPSDSTNGSSGYVPSNPSTSPLGIPNAPNVSMETGGMQVSWTAVSGVTNYNVYRSLGTGDWTLLTASGVSGSQYTDTTYAGLDQTQSLRYAVQSRNGSTVSAISAPSNRSSQYVLGVAATVLTKTGQIDLSWDSHGEATAYKIYRYPNDSGSTPVLITSTTTASFQDVKGSANHPTANTPYYYMVTWVKNSTEFGKTGALYALGASSDGSDFYEPNETMTSLLSQTASTVFNAGQPPSIYSFVNAGGSPKTDTDWYKYIGPSGTTLNVQIQVPLDSSFSNNELQFQFYYNGQYYPATPQNMVKGNNSFLFNQFTAGETGNASIYFRITTNLLSTRDVVGTYTVNLSNEL